MSLAQEVLPEHCTRFHLFVCVPAPSQSIEASVTQRRRGCCQVKEANRLTLMSQGGINAVLVAVEPFRKLKADLGDQEEEE